VEYLEPIRRWDILWANLDPVTGREQAGANRPVLIVSANRFNNSTLRLVMAIPLSAAEGKSRAFQPFEIPLPTGTIEAGVTPIALTQQLRTLSKQRLRGFAGRLDTPLVHEAIEDAILAHLGIDIESD
jgi:mRNA interferase MazF